jgi:hypothetical protein
MIKDNVLGSEYISIPAINISTTHVAEGQFLHEEHTLNQAKSLMYRAGTRRPIISKTEGQNLERIN